MAKSTRKPAKTATKDKAQRASASPTPKPERAGKSDASGAESASASAKVPPASAGSGAQPATTVTAPASSTPTRPQPVPSEFASMADAVAYLNGRTNVEQLRPQQLDGKTIFSLARMAALVAAMGNPQSSFKAVHVAGSKGKGSVCEMTSACLQACGYTVGLYTSPHLVDIRERIRIGQSMISEADFCRLLVIVARAAHAISKAHGDATHFELMTAMAFQHFADQAVDVAVVEVGLGGRTDATNVLTPEVCAIAAIQLEHTQVLGNTLEKIAREKAGIMKAGVPTVTISQPASVLAVFREVAEQVGAPLLVVGQDLEFSSRFEASPELGPHARVCLNTPRSQFEHLPVPLKGEHQALNCGLALAILDQLRARGVETPEGKVASGLSQTPNHGRLEMVLRDPRIVIDGAHNPESIAGLVKALGAQVRYDSLVVVFGCAADKDVTGMLTNLSMGADKLIFTRAEGSARAIEPKELQRKFAELSPKMTQVCPNVREAINTAARAVGRDDLIVVTGSFALAGEAKGLIHAKFRQPGAVAPRVTGASGTAASGVIEEIKPGHDAARPPSRHQGH
jgi:dihydrofolate synthase/folylpolyglutamate synthase